MSNAKIHTFEENLEVTKRYCALQLLNTDKSPAEILRNFNPDYNGLAIFDFELASYPISWDIKAHKVVKWSDDPAAVGYELFHDLFSMQMKFKRELFLLKDVQYVGGRILASEYQCCISDGASEAQSAGFIDIYDLPPIDTWFYLADTPAKKVLYSWIPEEFIELADEGVQVNALDILWWIDDRNKIIY